MSCESQRTEIRDEGMVGCGRWDEAGDALVDARQVPQLQRVPRPEKMTRTGNSGGQAARRHRASAAPTRCSQSVFTLRAKGVRDAHGQGALGANERIEGLPDKERPIGEVMAILESRKQGALYLLFAGHGEFFNC